MLTFFHNRQQTTTDYRGQSDLYVSFLLRQATQKPLKCYLTYHHTYIWTQNYSAPEMVMLNHTLPSFNFTNCFYGDMINDISSHTDIHPCIHVSPTVV